MNYVNKGCTSETILSAGKIANEAEMNLSVMIMPGLGGVKYLKEHEVETARVLSEIEPAHITLLTIDEFNNTPYSTKIMADKNNTPFFKLTESEKIKHIYNLLNYLNPMDGKIGCFSTDVTPVALNPVTFNNHPFNEGGKKGLLSYLNKQMYFAIQTEPTSETI